MAVCARNVFRIWEQTKEKRSAQLVFCDLSTPTTCLLYTSFDQLTSVDQDYFNEKYPPDIEPYIFCEWSESPVFEDGKRYGIREFDTLMKQRCV